MEGDPAGEALTRLRAKRNERRMKSKYFGKTRAQQQPEFHDPNMKQWHRRLSIIIWIMETMKTTEPYLRRPFTTCWQVCQPEIDPAEAKKHYEKTKADLAMWDSIEAKAEEDEKEIENEPMNRAKLIRQKSIKFKTVAKLTSLGCQFSANIVKTPFTSDFNNRIKSSDFHEVTEDEDESQLSLDKMKSKKKQQRTVKIKKPKKKFLSKATSPKSGFLKQISKTKKLPPLVMKSTPPKNFPKKKLPKFKPKKEPSGKEQPEGKRGLPPPPPQPVLDPHQVKEQFCQIRSQNDDIVREQLKAIERDARAGIKQRFSSLEVKSNFHSDLQQMRKGVVVESADVARRRLLVNFEWFKELKKKIPSEALRNVYISKIMKRMEPMSEYIIQNTDKMCSKRLLAVLGTLRRWEIDHCEVEFAVKHIINNIIYFPEIRYEHWLKKQYEHLKTRKIDDVEALSLDGHRLPIY